VDAYCNRAIALQALGDRDGALADLGKALEHVPRSAAAVVYHNRGAVRQSSGDLPGAVADFDQALALDPGHALTYSLRGSARHALGDLGGAVADFEQGIARTPHERSASFYHLRGGVRVSQGDLAAAIADYDTALEIDPRFCLVYISRANARYHRGDPSAYLDYLQAFAICPKTAAQELARVVAVDVRQDARAVLANCARHLKRNPRDVPARVRKGLTLLLLGQEAEAELDFAQARDLCPEIHGVLDGLIDTIRHFQRKLQQVTPLGQQYLTWVGTH
jgi:tetratricopeptide (TPR) repeat protein